MAAWKKHRYYPIKIFFTYVKTLSTKVYPSIELNFSNITINSLQFADPHNVIHFFPKFKDICTCFI